MILSDPNTNLESASHTLVFDGILRLRARWMVWTFSEAGNAGSLVLSTGSFEASSHDEAFFSMFASGMVSILLILTPKWNQKFAQEGNNQASNQLIHHSLSCHISYQSIELCFDLSTHTPMRVLLMHLSHVLLRWLYHREHLGAAPKGSTPRSRFGSTTVGDVESKDAFLKFHVLFKYFRLVLCFSKLVFARRWHPPVIGSFLNPRRALVREAQHWQKSKTFCYASSKPTEKSAGLHCRYL